MQRTKRVFQGVGRASVLLAMAATACRPGEAREAAAGVGADGDTGGPTVWHSVSSGGSSVRVVTPPEPMEAGTLTFEFEVDPPPPEDREITIDLASPEMPAHGVVRYPAEAQGEGRYRATAVIPMEGRWALYLNLDYGADAAAFEFDASPARGSEGHDHHGAGSTPEASASEGHDDHGGGSPEESAGSEGPEHHRGESHDGPARTEGHEHDERSTSRPR